MTKRFLPLLILFTFLFVGVVHACSGLNGMHRVSIDSASDDAAIAGQPCDHEKRRDDRCKSVRYRMLSLQAERTQNDLNLLASPLADALSSGDAATLARLLAVHPHPAASKFPFKHSPLSSYVVLRV